MPECPGCGAQAPPDRETGYDGADPCSAACEESLRPERFLVEVEVQARWVPAATGTVLSGRLLLFEDQREAGWWAAMLNARRGMLAYRVTATRETDAEIRRRR